MGTVIKGSDLMLFIKSDSETEYKSIAFATNHTLNISAETTSISSKDSGGGKWTANAVQKLSWTVSTENLYTLDGEGNLFNDLFQLMTSREIIDAVFTVDATYQSKPDEVPDGGWSPITNGQYAGQIIMTSLDMNAPSEDNASFTASFEGVGAISYIATQG